MEFQRTDDKGRYTAFTVSGEASVSGLVEILTTVRDRCRDEGRLGVFVDLTSTSGTLSGMDRFKVAFAILPKWSRKVRLAIAIRPDQVEPGRLGQLVAQNQGFRVRVFTDPSAAEAWLRMALDDDRD